MCRSTGAAIVLAWLLLSSRNPEALDARWERAGSYTTEYLCAQVRAAEIERATLDRIGSVLALQPPDNPMRQRAYGDARRRIEGRYRCSAQ